MKFLVQIAGVIFSAQPYFLLPFVFRNMNIYTAAEILSLQKADGYPPTNRESPDRQNLQFDGAERFLTAFKPSTPD